MAERFQRRTLEVADLRSPNKLLDLLNPLSEAVSKALGGGVSLGNLRKVVVTASVTPPDEWTRLELLNGATLYNNGSHDVPSVRWVPTGTDYKGLLTRPQGGISFALPFARIPEGVSTLRPRTSVVMPATASYLGGSVDVDSAGNLYLSSPGTFPVNGFVSLWRCGHDSPSVAPPWNVPVDATMLGEGGQDYGVPALVLVLSATRADRKPCYPDPQPMWEAPLIGEGKQRQRKLRIRRLGGLQSGVAHVVRLLALYD